MIVLANDGISKKGEAALKEAGIKLFVQHIPADSLADFINENKVDVLLVRSATQVPAELIDATPGLKIIGRGGVGMDNIAADYAKLKGIKVINTPLASAKSVAELVFAHFFSLARYLHDANRMMPLEGEHEFNTLKKSYSNATELAGKTLGVIGMGSIGMEVIKIGIALGMKIIAYNRTPKNQKVTLTFFDGQEVNFNIQSTDFETVLKEADFLSVNIAKPDQYILDTPQFEMMKESVYIVNAARGGVLNEVALLDFIDAEEIAGAALDVFEREPNPEVQILMHPSLSLSPHIGGNTVEAQERIGLELAEQLIKLNTNADI